MFVDFHTCHYLQGVYKDDFYEEMRMNFRNLSSTIEGAIFGLSQNKRNIFIEDICLGYFLPKYMIV